MVSCANVSLVATLSSFSPLLSSSSSESGNKEAIANADTFETAASFCFCSRVVSSNSFISFDSFASVVAESIIFTFKGPRQLYTCLKSKISCLMSNVIILSSRIFSSRTFNKYELMVDCMEEFESCVLHQEQFLQISKTTSSLSPKKFAKMFNIISVHLFASSSYITVI